MREIIKILPHEPDFHLFENFPKTIYPTDNPRFSLAEGFNKEFLEGCYLLKDDGKTLAKATLYHNPHLQYQGLNAWCVGNYEAVEDSSSALELLHYIAQQAKNQGAEYLIGPMNGSTWDNYRFSLHHQHVPFFLEPYHHLYYNQQFLDSGFQIIAQYYSSLDSTLTFDKPEILSIEKDLLAKGLRIRNINLNRFTEEIERIYEFNAEAFKTNFLYTPISKSAFVEKYAATRNIINPEFTILAEDKNGELIGYFFGIDDFANKKEKNLIVKTLARHPSAYWKGLGHVMGNVIYRRAAERQYQFILHVFIMQEGYSTTLSKNFSGKRYKDYVLYGKKL